MTFSSGSIREFLFELQLNHSSFTRFCSIQHFFTPDAADLIGKALAQNTTLRHLEFRGTTMHKESVKHIVQGIVKNTTLTTLRLDSICFVLSPDILNSSSITTLILNNITFVYSRIYELVYKLYNNTTLTSLELRNCDVDQHGIRLISRALRNNKTLQNLTFVQYYSPSYTLWKIRKALKVNTALQRVELGFNYSFPFFQYSKLCNTLHKHNSTLLELKCPNNDDEVYNMLRYQFIPVYKTLSRNRNNKVKKAESLLGLLLDHFINSPQQKIKRLRIH